MAKHARIRTDEQQERLERNRATMLSVLSGEQRGASSSTQTSGFAFVLERFIVDRTTWKPVAFEGEHGVEALLGELSRAHADELDRSGGHLVGMSESITVASSEEPLHLHVGLGPGAQLRLAVEPANNPIAVRDAIIAFDRQFHVAYKAMGCDFALITQGYHPGVIDPADVEMVPGTEHVLTNAFLARRGSQGRDLMRCTAATCLCLSYNSAEQAVGLYQLLTALSPLLAFLTDDTLHVRGSEVDLTPLMARTLLVERTVPRHIGIPDGMLGPEAELASYEQWLEGIRPIYLTSEGGEILPTGADTIEQLMCVRELTTGEAARLAAASWSVVRLLDGRIELSCADSLPPRLACAYLALVKGLTVHERAREAAARLLDLSALDEAAVQSAWTSLRSRGWDARVYGRKVMELANDLAMVASGGLDDVEERRMLASLTQLWEVECVPRDLAQVSPDPEVPRTPERELIDLYGDDAFTLLDESPSEPPGGSTDVLRFRHLF